MFLGKGFQLGELVVSTLYQESKSLFQLLPFTQKIWKSRGQEIYSIPLLG